MNEWVNDHLVQISHLEGEDTQAQGGGNLLQVSDRTETRLRVLQLWMQIPFSEAVFPSK